MQPNDEQIQKNREEIISLLASTNREGIQNVLLYLDSSGFYTAPSSEHRHHNWKGGLAQHSLGTFKCANKIGGDLPSESIILCSILHDVCKASKLYYDDEGKLRHRHSKLRGHGFRSIRLLELQDLKLSREEKLAIRWHMGGSSAKTAKDLLDLSEARRLGLCRAIFLADKMNAAANR